MHKKIFNHPVLTRYLSKGILFVVILFLLYGCALTAIDSGLPGETIVNAYGRDEILEHIEWLDRTTPQKGCPLNVISTKRVGMELDTVIEHWIVDSCGVKTRYKIRIAPLGQGRMKYIVTFPMGVAHL